MTALIDWVVSNPPPWAHDKILSFEEIFDRRGPVDALKFVTSTTFEPNSTMDMRDVVGQWDHYAGQSWFDAATIQDGKMRNVFAQYEVNPLYYFSGELKDGISCSSIDGKVWYSQNSGNHRTVVAKFACARLAQETGQYPVVSGVCKVKHDVCQEAYQLFLEMHRLNCQQIHQSVERVKLDCNDSSHLTSQYELRFHVCDFRLSRSGRCQHLTTEEFCNYARWILSTDAVLTRYEKWTHYWTFMFGDDRRLIYR